MANPLSSRLASVDAPTVFATLEDMRAWCESSNDRRRTAGWLSWVYVNVDKQTNARSIKERVGSDARDIWRTIDGWYPDFVNWDEERLLSEFRILRFITRMGMSEERYKTIHFAKHRNAPGGLLDQENLDAR